jgi:hypothetical protein
MRRERFTEAGEAEVVRLTGMHDWDGCPCMDWRSFREIIPARHRRGKKARSSPCGRF